MEYAYIFHFEEIKFTVIRLWGQGVLLSLFSHLGRLVRFVLKCLCSWPFTFAYWKLYCILFFLSLSLCLFYLHGFIVPNQLGYRGWISLVESVLMLWMPQCQTQIMVLLSSVDSWSWRLTLTCFRVKTAPLKPQH